MKILTVDGQQRGRWADAWKFDWGDDCLQPSRGEGKSGYVSGVGVADAELYRIGEMNQQ